MEKRVGPNQASFVPNCQASDNIIIVQKLIHSMRRKTGKKGSMAIKIDLQKAYDRVTWGFLKKILETVGFEQKLVAVIWNGKKLEPFSSQ